MLSNCSRSANSHDDSSDADEELVHGHMHAVTLGNSVPPSSNVNVGTPPRSALHSRTDAIASPRRTDVDADVALPKDSYTPRQLLISAKGTQLMHHDYLPHIAAEQKTDNFTQNYTCYDRAATINSTV